MATRFMFHSSGTSPLNSLAFDSQWEQTGQAVRRPMNVRNLMAGPTTALTDSAVTVPITTTQQILHTQFVSQQIFKPARLDGSYTTRAVIRGFENATTNNSHLAMRVRAVTAFDGREMAGGVFASSMGTLTEFVATAATRLLGLVSVTNIVLNEPWRLVFELGVHAQAPGAAGSATLRLGCNAASDFAYTSALTTDLNPWFEISANLNALSAGMQHLRGFVIG